MLIVKKGVLLYNLNGSNFYYPTAREKTLPLVFKSVENDKHILHFLSAIQMACNFGNTFNPDMVLYYEDDPKKKI